MVKSAQRKVKKKARRKKRVTTKKLRLATKTQIRKVELERIQKYPTFTYDEFELPVVSESFVNAVTQILKTIRFDNREQFPPGEEEFYRLMKKHGFHETFESAYKTNDVMKDVALEHHLVLKIGEIVYKKLDEQGLLEKYIHFNHFYPRINKTDFRITFSSLLQEKSKWGTVYFSTTRPKIEINGKQWIVAFSRHAIERISERCVTEPKSYAGGGDIFGYIEGCRHFEYLKVCYEDRQQELVTFYEECSEGFFKYNYVKQLIENFNPDRKYYYRVGYCPIGLAKEFASAKTLLSPGMKGTPEYSLLLTSKLSQKERELIERGIYNCQTYKRLYDTKDFHAIKWFHDNGIPQVIEI